MSIRKIIKNNKSVVVIWIVIMLTILGMSCFVSVYLNKNITTSNLSWVIASSFLFAAIYAIKIFFNWKKYMLAENLTRESKINNVENLVIDNLFFIAYLTAPISILLLNFCARPPINKYKYSLHTIELVISFFSSGASIIIFILVNFVFASKYYHIKCKEKNENSYLNHII